MGAESGAAEFRVDFSKTNGVFKRLNGGNNGPLCYGELVDLTAFHKELGVPSTRLHDSAWPYPDIVDIHAIFPNPEASPGKPDSYRFGPTDDYLKAIVSTGSEIVYRLGESIEHAKRKRYVKPPLSAEKWAAVCLGIIRHYNEGWADGSHLGIRHWEIWNEPENRPAMWTGTPEEYYKLYSVTAKTIKLRWPSLKVGGPSLGHQGEFKHGVLEPSPFLRDFMAHIQKEGAPLDFFSWHLYTDDPAEAGRRAVAVRAFLDAAGLKATESHLNEWNYLPGNDWMPMTQSQGARREQWYARQGGAEGAAFAAAVLMNLQNAPLDVANFYAMDNQPFGLFSLHGAPKLNFYAFKAFRELTRNRLRAEATGGEPSSITMAAGYDLAEKEGCLLLSNVRSVESRQVVRVEGWPWNGPSEVEFRLLDEKNELVKTGTERVSGRAFNLNVELKAPAVTLIRIKPLTGP